MTANELWAQVLSALSGRLSPEEIGRWLKPLSPNIENSGETVRLIAPNRFFVDWVKENYLDRLSETFELVRSRPVSVIVSMMGEIDLDPPASQARPGGPAQPAHTPRIMGNGIQPRYTFSSFVVGPGNQFSHAAAFAVANLPGGTYNPLFIYSGAGLGKTHLISAVGNYIVTKNQNARVAYLSSEEFTNQMIMAIRNKAMESFRARYRNIDALLIDDVQFLGDKERTQEEFFFTFNALYEQGSQIVLTSDTQPKEIPSLEERLRSRFEWGLIADIQPPDRETKVAIIQKKAEEERLTIPEEVAHYLASSDEDNIRVLEGYLVRVAAYASMTDQTINLDLAKEVLKTAIHRREVTVDDILRVVGVTFNVRLADLRSGKRQKKMAEPRQIAMYLARQMTELPLVQIGQKFGGKDHSTILHAVKKIQAMIDQDKNFRQEIEHLKQDILRSR